MTDWDAGKYHRLSEPQLAWGRKVAARLSPVAGERILDLGCGTGRLTAELASEFPGVTFIGADVSQAMLANAAGRKRVRYVRADGAALPFTCAFDAVFSTAAFHWIPDHRALFGDVYRALKPGGRLIAQCGGGPNLKRLLDRAHQLMDGPEFGHFFHGWSDPWRFAAPAETRELLLDAGFSDIDVTLESAPTTLVDRRAFADFISCVCVRHHVDRLPASARATFVDRLADAAAGDDPPFTLDYWRLNVVARKPRTRGALG